MFKTQLGNHKYGRFKEEDKWFKRVFAVMLVFWAAAFVAVVSFWVAIAYVLYHVANKVVQ